MEFGTLKLPDLEEDWHYMLLKPPNFNESEVYPLLVEVYSGNFYNNYKLLLLKDTL